MHPLRFWFYALALMAAATLLPGSIYAASTAGKPTRKAVVKKLVVKKLVVKSSSMRQELRHGQVRRIALPGGALCPCKD